jgi:hypothetical protein
MPRRFPVNGFSRKWENHAAAVVLWYCWYNFGRIHRSLRVTPAMAAGIADHVWARVNYGRPSKGNFSSKCPYFVT